jgi:DNA (cytosine-5)-methyltransferase 1
MLLLDLFCGAGGAGEGYRRAGFEVFGVDLADMPRNPHHFQQGDALEFLAEHGHEFDAIHASPPCQDHSTATKRHGRVHGTGWLLAATREALEATGRPWVIENVPGAPMRADFRLCGCQFGLPGLQRKRLFETSWSPVLAPPRCVHVGRTITVSGHTGGSSTRDGSRGFGTAAEWRAAMGIDWMTTAELAQAIPPAYTQFIGERLAHHVRQHDVQTLALR